VDTCDVETTVPTLRMHLIYSNNFSDVKPMKAKILKKDRTKLTIHRDLNGTYNGKVIEVSGNRRILYLRCKNVW